MKANNFINILIGSFVLSLTSCQPVYFTAPQPFDAENIYEFPKEYRGLWVNEGDTTIIGKNYFIIKEYKQKNSIAKKEIDTSTVYILKTNKIYIKEKYDDIGLSEGFPYKLHNDSVQFNAREITKVALSYETFLRKVGKYYILNTSNTKNWWNIYLIKKTDNQKIEVYILDEDDLKNLSNFETIYKSKEGIFIAAKWSKKEMLFFIDNGQFSELILELDLKEKKPLPK